jgi:hypothetical protein
MHFKSKEPVTVLGKQVKDTSKNDNYPLTKDQYKKIIENNNITDKTFNFTYKGESLAVSSNFNYDQTVINNSLENVLSTWSPENGTKTLERMNNTY